MSDEFLRLFIAVSVPRGHLELVDVAVQPLKQGLTRAKWTSLDNQHVTLKFLGRTPSARLPGIADACAHIAAEQEPAVLRLGELGAFPNARRARVLWVGLEDDEGLLARLASRLDASLASLGFEPEARAFTPHLTLARFRPASSIAPLPVLPAVTEPFEVSSFQLWRSHLHPKGARYEVLQDFSLGPD